MGEPQRKSMPRTIRQAVENELMNFPVRKKRLELLKEEIYHSGNRELSDMPRGSNVHSITERKALELNTDEILWLEKRIRQMNSVMESLTPEERQIVQVRYFENRYTHEGTRMELNITSARAYYGKRDRILEQFAYALGYWYM